MCEGKTARAQFFTVASHSGETVERVKSDRSLEMSAEKYLTMPT